MELIVKVNSFLNGIVMGWPGMILLVGTGVYYTIRCGGVQFKWFGYIMKTTIGKIFDKKEAGEGSVTPFQAVCTALAATVGTGNIAGVTGAIALGGPGAVFWMWLIALLGGATAFVESTLAQIYKKRAADGSSYGGPSYYIQAALNSRALGVVFAVALIATYAGGFNMLASYNLIDSFPATVSMTNISSARTTWSPSSAARRSRFWSASASWAAASVSSK